MILSPVLPPETVTRVPATGPEFVQIGRWPELGHVVTRVAAGALAEGEIPVGVEAGGERHCVVRREEALLRQELSKMLLHSVSDS